MVAPSSISVREVDSYSCDDHLFSSSFLGRKSRLCLAQSHRKIVLLVTSIVALVTIAVLLGLSNSNTNRKKKGKDHETSARYGNISPDYTRPSVSVYESSMYTGARLEKHESSSSPMGLKEDCVPFGDGGDGHHRHHHHHTSTEDEGTICPEKGKGAVVVESSKKLQEMLGFGGGFTDSATINFYKLPPDVQEKVQSSTGRMCLTWGMGRVVFILLCV